MDPKLTILFMLIACIIGFRTSAATSFGRAPPAARPRACAIWCRDGARH